MPHTPTYSRSVAHSLSPAFHPPLVAYHKDSITSNAPGPSSYTPQLKTLGKLNSAEGGAEFVFKSKTNRSQVGTGLINPGKDAPPPGNLTLLILYIVRLI